MRCMRRARAEGFLSEGGGRGACFAQVGGQGIVLAKEKGAVFW
jgi:hypothetical protein